MRIESVRCVGTGLLCLNLVEICTTRAPGSLFRHLSAASPRHLARASRSACLSPLSPERAPRLAGLLPANNGLARKWVHATGLERTVMYHYVFRGIRAVLYGMPHTPIRRRSLQSLSLPDRLIPRRCTHTYLATYEGAAKSQRPASPPHLCTSHPCLFLHTPTLYLYTLSANAMPSTAGVVDALFANLSVASSTVAVQLAAAPPRALVQ